MGALLIVPGAVFLSAAVRRRFSIEVLILAVGSAAVLAVVDITYALQGRTSLVYLLDAMVELLFLALWIKGYWWKSFRSCCVTRPIESFKIPWSNDRIWAL